MPCFRLWIFLVLVVQVKTDDGILNSRLNLFCRENPSESVNLIIELAKIPVLKIDSSLRIPLKGNALNDYVQRLKKGAAEAQRSILSNLQDHFPTLEFTGFWITNKIAIDSFPCGSLNTVVSIPGVLRVRREEIASLHADTWGGTVISAAESSPAKIRTDPAEWGIRRINAPQVWDMGYRGSGMVVANIDTGVRYSHEALVKNYRNDNYSWLNGNTNKADGKPSDNHGHGTHTIATICGRFGIGVAPEAKWIACQACNKNGCSEKALTICGQWIMCPYNSAGENCDSHPHVVNNSWGAMLNTSTTWYRDIIQNWHAAGIIPVYSIGNSGSACSTAGYPGELETVIGVGATSTDDSVAKFSSRGPSREELRLKPDVVAPGYKIRSAWATSDSDYRTLNGTSMAAPHVAGAITLMLQKNYLLFQEIVDTLKISGFQPDTGLTNYHTCNCLSESSSTCQTDATDWPNNAYGYGRIDLSRAFQLMP